MLFWIRFYNLKTFICLNIHCLETCVHFDLPMGRSWMVLSICLSVHGYTYFQTKKVEITEIVHYRKDWLLRRQQQQIKSLMNLSVCRSASFLHLSCLIPFTIWFVPNKLLYKMKQMTDARCSRCTECKVGVREIIQTGHGERYKVPFFLSRILLVLWELVYNVCLFS